MVARAGSHLVIDQSIKLQASSSKSDNHHFDNSQHWAVHSMPGRFRLGTPPTTPQPGTYQSTQNNLRSTLINERVVSILVPSNMHRLGNTR